MSIVASSRLITLTTGNNTDGGAENTGGTSTGGLLQLPSRGQLIAASITISGSTTAGPIRAYIRVVPELDVMAVRLASGWIRNDAIFAEDSGIDWVGSVPLGSDSRLQVGLRNDTGSTEIMRISWLVET